MQTLRKIISITALFAGSLLLLGTTANPAHAEVIDRIQINRAGDEAEIKIQFVTRVQFLRQVMLKNGDIRLYFNLLELDAADKRQVQQRRDSPPSNLVTPFTLTYPEIDSSMTISFGKELSSYHIRPGNDGRSISFFTPIVASAGKVGMTTPEPEVISPAEPVKPVITPPSNLSANELNELAAKQLMDNASAMQSSGLLRAQAAMLRKLVALPPNKQTQAALITLAKLHEQLGEFDKARENYVSYVTLYPKAKDLKQAQDNLARMIMAAYAAKKSVPEKIVVEDKLMTFGGFSQYYYRGLAQIDNRFPVVSSANITDQSHLVSSLDITSMKRTTSTETRWVLRDTFTASLLKGASSNNFLDVAFVEQATNDQSYYYGLGRKTGSSGGVPSRYDGAWLGHNFNDAWKISGAVGQPSRIAGSTEEAKTFAAINLALTRQSGEWSGNTYLASQRVGKFIDRRVVGVETNLDTSKSNHTVQAEYDTLFKTLNFGSLQSNWTSAADDNYTLLLDHRRSPTLQASNALIRELPTQTVAVLGVSQNTLLANALIATPLTNQLSVGMTHPYSPRVKFGGDIRISNTTGYEGNDTLNSTTTVLVRKIFPSARATTYSAQIIGNSLLFDNDLGIASASLTNASTYSSKSLSFSQVTTFKKDWRLDLSLSLFAQSNVLASDGDVSSISPNLKISYRSSTKQNFEFGAGLQQFHNTSPSLDSRTRRKFFNLGYRWDFQ
ncbi:MAG: hypothetical protein ABL911_06275 [Gallionella sp.]